MALSRRSLILQCQVDQHLRVRKISSWHESLPEANRADVTEGWLTGLLSGISLTDGEHCLFTTSHPTLLSGRDVDVQVEPLEQGARISIYCSMAQRSLSRRATDRTAAVFNALYGSNLDALVTIDTRGAIMEFNAAAEAMLGYRQQEVQGAEVAEIILPFGKHDVQYPDIAGYFTVGKAPLTTQRFEFEATRRDGSRFPCEITLAPAQINGEIAFFSAFLRDISGRKANEAALTRAKEAAEAGSQAKSRFLAHMSHEVRSPVSAILGCLELLSDTALDNEQNILVKTADDAGHNLLDVIEDILSFSKIESGTYQLQSRVFSPIRVLEQVVESAAVRSASRELHIGCCIAPDVPLNVVSDPVALRQIVSNLVDNALKFTQEGGVSVRVYVQGKDLNADHLDLRIVVQDTGVGIGAGDQEKIFEEFTQADSSDRTNFGGAGLGLSICKRLLEALGGHITVSSEPGKGSCFQVVLPCGLADDTTVFFDTQQALPEIVGVSSDNTCFASDVAEQVALLGSSTCAADQLTAGDAAPLVIDVSPGTMPSEVIALWSARGFQPEQLILALPDAYSEWAIEARKAGVRGVIARPFTATAMVGALLANSNNKSGNAKVKAPGGGARLNYRILLAEDSKANQLIATTLLEKAGCVVDIAENGQEAIDAVKAEHYDAVLMDVRMPLVDGLTATREIRHSHSTDELPIIALTANVFGSDVDRCLDAGMNDFIGKPVSRDKLLSVLSRWVEGAADAIPSHPKQEEVMHPLIDDSVLDQLKRDTSDEAALVILQALQTELFGFIDVLKGYADSGTLSGDALATLRDSAHRCKSSAGYCGAVQVQELSQQLEKACVDNQADVALELIQALIDSAEETQAVIATMLD
ncbi:ATP-binding protein [Litorivivens sp.]|uniref:ATP-binding protein n=1 Tax=Litorivivens sp. TaxID=2020868 RepID=UPI003563E07B